ncbi:carbonic anhydrase, partial [Yersinia enterocolitica]
MSKITGCCSEDSHPNSRRKVLKAALGITAASVIGG